MRLSLNSPYLSSIITPLMRTLFEILVFILTVQLGPKIQFFNEVFSDIVVLSPTAHSVICVDRMVLSGEIRAGAAVGNSFAQKSNI